MTIKALILGTALLAATSAQAALTLNTNGGSGSVTGTQTDFVLTGSDDGSGNPNLTTFADVALAHSLVSGSYTYQSFDADGPFYDPAGYIAGSLVQLSNSGGPAIQTGTFSFEIVSGQTYGFYVNSSDSVFGAGQLTVNGLTIDAIPEPATWGLMIVGFGLVGVAARRRSAVTA